MKNVKILATLVVLPILGMVSYVHADSDCSTVDREAIKTLLDKQTAGSVLTSDEAATLKNAESCRPTEGSGSTMRERKMRFGSGQTMPERTGTGTGTGSGMMMRNHDNKFGSGQTLTDEQKTQMEQIKALRDKQKNGETLTTEEQAILDAHQAQMKENTQEKKQENRQEKATTKTKLSNTYQKAIDNKIENLVGNYSTKDDKINALNAFWTKISALKTNLDSLNLSENKKTTYNNVIDYLLQKIDDTVNNLNDGTDTDTLLNEILN